MEYHANERRSQAGLMRRDITVTACRCMSKENLPRLLFWLKEVSITNIMPRLHGETCSAGLVGVNRDRMRRQWNWNAE